MITSVLSVLCLLSAAYTLELTDEQYYTMPQLFELDDFDVCIALRGAFCLGSFHLQAAENSQLMNMIQEFSETRNKFNHTVLHRGYCLNSTCSHIPPGSMPGVFEECLKTNIRTKYGLEAKLMKLDYCTTEPERPMNVDTFDIIFGAITLILICANMTGTAYDLFRNPDVKPNRYLMTWSLRVNLSRLVAVHDKEDANLAALNPLHGLKAILMIMVVMVHSIIAHHMTYIHNPRFFEEAIEKPHMTLFNNGTTVVQIFIILSSFLLAYNVILALEKQPKRKITFTFWLKIVMHRFIRMTPLNVYVVGMTASWWRSSSSGPLWPTLVEEESARCRRKWWTHALYLNNVIEGDDRCQVQSWFLATDMQLYVLATVLVVFLVKRPKFALKFLPVLFVLSIAANFCISYFFNMYTIIFITTPETIRNQYFGVQSFQWLYATSWFSLPSTIIGLFLAFAYHQMKTSNYKLHQNKLFLTVYAVSVPSAFAWVFFGYVVRSWDSPVARAAYSAIERPGFDLIIIVVLLGFFFNIDNMFRSLAAWSAWRVPSRMSLSILLIHWGYNLTMLGLNTVPVRLSIYNIGGHWLGVLFMTYVTALPLHLMVEAPVQKFLEAIFICH